jgi:bacteriorhodopsin
VIKIAVPWELGHTVALGYANADAGAVPAWLWVLTAVIYGWLLANLVLLIIPSRRPLHDRFARTIVVLNGESARDDH